MPGRVVDASAVAALLFVEPQAADVADRLEGFELAAPALLPYELASVARKKAAKHPDMAESVLDALWQLGDLGITLVDVDPPAAVRLALSTGLSSYDASYLLLSQKLGLPLVTLDSRLSAATKRKR